MGRPVAFPIHSTSDPCVPARHPRERFRSPLARHVPPAPPRPEHRATRTSSRPYLSSWLRCPSSGHLPPQLTRLAADFASLAAESRSVRSQPEVWCWFHVSRSSEQSFTARRPAPGSHERATLLRPRPCHVTASYAPGLVPSSREQHANRPAHLSTPRLRFSAPCPHFASGRAPIGPSRLVPPRNQSHGCNTPSLSFQSSSLSVRASGSPCSRRPGRSKLSGATRGASVRLFIKGPAAA
jgi:hypothetical protein